MLYGLDIGGSTLKAVKLSADGTILGTRIEPAGGRLPRDALLEQIRSAVEALMEGEPPRRIGLAFGGTIQPDGTMLSTITNLPNLAGLPLVETFSTLLGAPCRVENDARAAMRGEGGSGIALAWGDGMIAIVEAQDYSDMSRITADIVVAQLKEKPDSLLVLPTGNSPIGFFHALVKRQQAGKADFRTVRFVTLDEYAGIRRDDPRRLFSWLKRELFDPLGIAASHIHAFDPQAAPEAEAERIERAITDAGGIDLAVLGLGPNGHLGFNEPGSAIDSRTRLVTLAVESISSNAAYWGSEAAVPHQAFTL